MIAPVPGTPAWAVLQLVVGRPGKLDAEAIGQSLWCPKLASQADYLGWRRTVKQHGPGWSARASELLGRLVEAGLVERQRPPQLAPRWAGASVQTLLEEAIPGDWEGDTGQIRVILTRLVQKLPSSMTEWVGAAPSGHTQRLVRHLVEWEVVVPPAHRWPTQAGIALIQAGIAPPPPPFDAAAVEALRDRLAALAAGRSLIEAVIELLRAELGRSYVIQVAGSIVIWTDYDVPGGAAEALDVTRAADPAWSVEVLQRIERTRSLDAARRAA